MKVTKRFSVVAACAFAVACQSASVAPVAPVAAPVAVSAAAPVAAVVPVADPREAAARELVQNLAAGRTADAVAHFDATMKSALPAEKVAAVWTSIIGQFGAYRDVAEAHSSEEGPYHSVFLLTRFERANLTAKVVFNASGEVAGLFFVPAGSSAK
jgi:hypothetical protein